MGKNKRSGALSTILFLAIGGVVLFGIAEDIGVDLPQVIPPAKVEPDWTAIAAWPGRDADAVEATPDPNRRITVIVLDDSGSMGGDMPAAKQAVFQAVQAMEDSDRVAVLALNRGVVLPFTDVVDARDVVGPALDPVRPDGSTPLGAAMGNAQEMLAQEAAMARAFGTYRMIITTDGQADSDENLTQQVEGLAATTPIQVATIGIAISGGHVLRRNDLGSFVDVSNIEGLQAALTSAIAESLSFDAVTSFDGGN
ncbi:MAG: VWA domain-containing protein [Marinovum sp.]|nr:VWA domain-containing protein [Marinovum sp.]